MNWRHILLMLSLAALPASSNYELGSYGFGTGGTAGSSSSNYAINGIAGEAGGAGSSSNYRIGIGENYQKQANVPTVSIVNSDNWYNKLLVTINPQSNPSDALFAIAISKDNFATTQYVKSDFTVGDTLTFNDYLTYSGWGGGSGTMVRGLWVSSIYTVKVKAYRGKFTESPYGPSASAATSDAQLAFDIDVAATNVSTNPPYNINIGDLFTGQITATSDRIWVSLATNGESGGNVYVSGQYGGLHSSIDSYTIAAQTGDLSSIAEGYGAQGVSATQASGGPFVLSSPYDGTSENIGIVDTVIREIFSTSGPVTGGRGSFILKAKTQPLTPSSEDYADLLTAIASASF